MVPTQEISQRPEASDQVNKSSLLWIDLGLRNRNWKE
jgi:hypothetical protein